MESANNETSFLTVRQFIEKHPAFTNGGIRAVIFWRGDDAEKAGAIVHFGRRILIDENRFLAWVREGGTKRIRGAEQPALGAVARNG